MSLKKIRLSTIIIARNEETKISECINSVKEISAEILVFDNNSTDKTSIIAKKLGCMVYKIETGDFSERKNYAFTKAKYGWILLLDADERLGENNIKEIVGVVNKPDLHFAAYAFPRKNIIFGKEFKFGRQSPDYVVRLFKKDKFIRWEGELHEQPIVEGKLGYLRSPITHLKHDNLSEMVKKTNDWSEIEARLMYVAKHPPMNLVRFFTAIWREFYLRMIKQKSFMDGVEGVIYALYQVFSRFLSYAKLWEMQIKK